MWKPKPHLWDSVSGLTLSIWPPASRTRSVKSFYHLRDDASGIDWKGLKASLWPNPLFHSTWREKEHAVFSHWSKKPGLWQYVCSLTSRVLVLHQVIASKTCAEEQGMQTSQQHHLVWKIQGLVCVQLSECSWSGRGSCPISLLLFNQLGHTKQVPPHGLCPCCASAWTTLFQHQQVILSSLSASALLLPSQ